MKNWWGIHNVRSLDGLPAFSVGMGLGFKFEVNFGRLLQGMRSDILGSQFEVAQNANSSRRVINSSPSPSDQSLMPKMIGTSLNSIFETSSLSQLLRDYRSRHEAPPSPVSALLPLFIAFILGVLLGQMYDKHTFPLSQGAARLSSSFTSWEGAWLSPRGIHPIPLLERHGHEAKVDLPSSFFLWILIAEAICDD